MSIRWKRVEWGPGRPRRRTGEANWRQPRLWNRKAKAAGTRLRVFSASLADIFDAEAPADWRQDFWNLVSETPHLDGLVLTKRPQNMERMLPETWGSGWPNVLLGATAENQECADQRIPPLLEVPAAVHFASCEPLLGAMDLTPFPGLDWVIVGGETGPNARPMDIAWARGLREQCQEAGIRFFFKQWGDHDASGRWVGKKRAGRLLGGRTWDEVPAPAESD